MLAKLAELGLLRRIEVISTVSGGSIVGALYYLRLKAKLDKAAGGRLADTDYFEIVRDVIDDYYRGAAKNLRARVLLSLLKNLRYAFPNYTRTDRMGELYEQHFYRRAWGKPGRIAMRDLKIHPGDDETFRPATGNAGRSSKVPILLLNATTLNTGHNWRFAAQYMGEPSASDENESDVDKNVRLCLTEWGKFQARSLWRLGRLFAIDYDALSLGAAVASSACFPIGFPPKAMPRLFVRKAGDQPVPMTVELVDGGVHDNQGIEGLTDSDREHSSCTHMVISDASGQMADEDEPSGRIPALLPRIVAIEGKVDREQRVLRAMEAGDAADDKSGTDTRGRIAFMHLQTGLDSAAIRPLKTAETDPMYERQSPVKTGVDPRAQKLLSRVRTDLDAFSEVEALSLMLDGYRLAGAVVSTKKGIMALALEGASVPRPSRWRFEDVAEQFDKLPEGYLRRLRVAEQRFFKPLRLALAPLISRRDRTDSELAQRVTRRRWTERLGGVAWLGVLAGLVIAGVVLSSHHVNAAVLYSTLVGLVAALFLYVSPHTPGLGLISKAVFSVLVPLLLWPFLPVLAGLQLLSGWLHVRSGRVPVQPREQSAPESDRPPEAPASLQR